MKALVLEERHKLSLRDYSLDEPLGPRDGAGDVAVVVGAGPIGDGDRSCGEGRAVAAKSLFLTSNRRNSNSRPEASWRCDSAKSGT